MVQIFEYENKPIQFEVIDGHVMANATLMFRAGKSRLDHWKDSESTKKYIEAVTRKMGIAESQMVVTKRGGSEQGTWIHEKLILNAARYIDIDFELWCDSKISELIREGHVRLGVNKNEFDMLAKQTERPVQIQNSKDINAHNFEKGGKELTVRYNRVNCEIHTGFKPSEVVAYAKSVGLPSKMRTSAKEVFRHKRPAVSASMSLADEFCKKGNMQIEEAAELCKSNALPLFEKMNEMGMLNQ